MRLIRFGNLPLLARFSVGLSFFTAWVVFEETIVDRHGLWKYMPDYRIGGPCVWDLGMALLIVVGLAAASRCTLRCCQQVARRQPDGVTGR